MVPVEFLYEKMHAYLLLDKLNRNYQNRNSYGTKRGAVCKIFTPELLAEVPAKSTDFQIL